MDWVNDSGRRPAVLLLLCTLALFTGVGCATYYQKNIKFQEAFVSGRLEDAAKILDRNRKAAEDRNRLLYFLQRGVVLQMLGDYEGSSDVFERAYLYGEDRQKNDALEAASFLTNPMTKPYPGEDFELVLLHHYKALNYLLEGRYDEALVECRRIDIKLNKLNDRYPQHKNRYRRDAFAMALSGMVYEAAGDQNNAFIAYRNAYEAYRDDYASRFGTPVPEQLKRDLMRSAYRNGFSEELAGYEREFGIRYEHREPAGGELVFFWYNGLGPVKDEWSVSFFIVRGQGGLVTFVNEELGLAIPFPAGSGGGGTSLGDLRVVRVAFPQYRERKPYFRSAELVAGDRRYPLGKGEDVNAIAFKTLEDRMTRELGRGLMRLAVKQAAEQAVRSQNQNLGALLSIADAVSEKADTRNWQTLPHEIHYARVPLPEGHSRVELRASSPRSTRTDSRFFEFEVGRGETVFSLFHHLESLPVGQ